ncbi:hypothetical protein HMJ29_07375 [Hymenobacter taeanensis]|uniref:Uncharacterized protein n=1 Tax=Hymenobacter taeanensis TaxID=2735321 RepID=A0A6M6BG05_9BACT|nr:MULTISPECIES: hypothetical protein [Hymenobacter]QJX46768.1 hypothetical protein HMJ29_07375 [Hymenobacter taeanensis]UOQ80637.1 hypothetical protein MUN83_17720 [Hymenobacter sp. 5414T-23]
MPRLLAGARRSGQFNGALQAVNINSTTGTTAPFGTASRSFIEESAPENPPNIKGSSGKEQGDDEILYPHDGHKTTTLPEKFSEVA